MRKLFILVLILAVAGCVFTEKNKKDNLPVYDRVLVFERPYDYTFLKTLEALNTFPEWVLEETDKNKGLIALRNTQYAHLFDRDKWVAKFEVRRLDRRKTSVALAPESQKLEKGGELLERIEEVVNISTNIEGKTQIPDPNAPAAQAAKP